MTSTSFVEELDAADAVAPLECEEVLLVVLFDGTVRALSVEDGCEMWRVIPTEDSNPRLPMASYEESLGDVNNTRKGAFRSFKSLIPGLGAAAKEVFTLSVDGRYLQRIDGLLSSGAPRFGTLHSTNSAKCEYCEVDAITGKVLAASIRDASLRARRRTEMSHFGGQEGDEARTLVITRETKINEGFEQLTGNSWIIRVNVVDIGGRGPRPDSTPPSVTRGDGSQAAIGAFPEGAILPKSSLMSTSEGGGSFVESDALKLSQVVSVCVSGGIKLFDPLTRETVWDVELDSPVIQAYLVSVPKRLNLRSVQRLSADRGKLVRSGTDSSLDTSSCPSQTPVSPIGSISAGLPSSPLLPRWVTRRQANSALLQVTPIHVTCERPTAFPHSPATPTSCTSSRSTTRVFPMSTQEGNGTAGSLVPSNGSPNSTRRSGGYFDADRRFLFIPNSSDVELDGFPRTESEVLAERYEVLGPDIDGGGIFTVMPCSPVTSTPTPTQRGFPTRSLGKAPTRLSSFPTAPKPSATNNVLLIKSTPTTSPKSTPSSMHTPTPSGSQPMPSHHTSIPRGPTLAPDSHPSQFQFPIPSFLRQTYQLVGRLGKGGYGVVFLIKPYHVNVTFALKAVFFNPGQIKTDDARRRILNEVEIAATLKSEHFLRPGNTWIEPVTPQLVSWLAAAPDLAFGGSDGIDTASLPIVEVLDSTSMTASHSVAATSVVTDIEYASALRNKFFDGFTSSATTTTIGQAVDPFSPSTTTTSTSDSSFSSSTSDPSSVPEDESTIDDPPGSARGPTPTPLKDDNGQLIVRDTPGTLVVTSQNPQPFSLTDPAAADITKNTWSMVNASPSRTPYILFLQMEFCPMTLTQWLLEKHQTSKSSSEVLSQLSYQRTARSLSIQLFRALSVLQRRSLLHRDIKPSNLFLVSSSNEVRCGDHGESDSSDANSSGLCDETYILKVGDFGLATCVSFAGLPSAFEGLSQRGSVEDLASSSPTDTTHTKTGHNSCVGDSATSRNLTSGIGSPLYAAPEQWHGSQYGTKADVFSAGLVLVELFCLFDTASERSHVFNDIRRRGPAAVPDELTTSNPQLSSIIGKCLELSPSNRSSATETLKLLKHLETSS